MQHLHHTASSQQRAPTLAILLPPTQSSAADLQREGFVAAAQSRAVPLDLTLVDIDTATITDGSALTLLRREVVAPARQASYSSVWMMGISIGGYLAIAYDDCYPRELDGLCLLAPYPASRLLWGEVVASGGIAQWQPGEVSMDDHEWRVWRWLKQRQDHALQLHLGLGTDDRFARGQEVMASALPACEIDRIPGSHDWPVWLQLWQRFLERQFGGAGKP